MEENRLVRKYFKCSNCKIFDSKLLNPSSQQYRCHTCHQNLKEISESEYKKLKQKLKERQRKNANRINENQNNEERHRGNSQLHYSRMNINVENERNNNNRQQNNNNRNNININNNNNNQHHHNQGNNNNINNNNRNNNDNRQRRDNRHHHTSNRRRREHSSERNNQNNNLFENIFDFFSPSQNRVSPLFGNNRNPFRIVVQRQNVPHDIFDPGFSLFGSVFNGLFQDNFSSNFRSNYRGNFLNEILNTIERNQRENRRQAHPPTTEDNLKKLKKFCLTEKYCKKEKDGKLELPNCCICLDEINIGAKTILLPCGHMFHSDCIITWLKKNNTCPMCRFEIK